MPTVIMNSKIIISGVMTILLLVSGINSSLSMMFSGSKNYAEIINYNNEIFYGNYIIDDNKIPIIVRVDEGNEKIYNENKTYDENKKNERINQNEKIIDDKTPGKINISFKDGSGLEINYNRDIGSKEMSETDKECLYKIVDAIIKYIDNSVGKQITKGTKKFLNFIKKDVNYKGK